jgi:hypothetical protein
MSWPIIWQANSVPIDLRGLKTDVEYPLDEDVLSKG